MRLAKILYRFSQATHHYSEILPPHIVKIITEDEKANSSRYGLCKQYLDRLMATTPLKDAKIKGNMVFSTHCLNDAF
jgi:hypothetical protein